MRQKQVLNADGTSGTEWRQRTWNGGSSLWAWLKEMKKLLVFNGIWLRLCVWEDQPSFPTITDAGMVLDLIPAPLSLPQWSQRQGPHFQKAKKTEWFSRSGAQWMDDYENIQLASKPGLPLTQDKTKQTVTRLIYSVTEVNRRDSPSSQQMNWARYRHSFMRSCK